MAWEVLERATLAVLFDCEIKAPASSSARIRGEWSETKAPLVVLFYV